MPHNEKINELIILCGGKGERIRDLYPNIPKACIPINGKPFILYLINFYKSFFNKIILATGYKSQNIREILYSRKLDNIFYSEEISPLGTGGSIIKALKLISNNFFIVCNGDSFIDINLNDLCKYHIQTNSDCSIVVTKNSDLKDLKGNINFDNNNLITEFSEKVKKTKYVNAGIYIFSKKIFDNFNIKKLSLEFEILPTLVKNYKISAYISDNPIIDIGNPINHHKNIEILSNYN